MPAFSFLQIDAFTDQPLSGNACAIVFDDDSSAAGGSPRLDAPTMLAIARENNLSETSFVRRPSPGSGADFAARYFTPGEEIPLAGHPTIATAYALVETGRLALRGPGSITRFRLELPAGVIPIDVETDTTGSVRNIIMEQLAPQFLTTYPAADALAVFGLSEKDALPSGPPPQVVSTGTRQLMLGVRDLDALRRARLDAEALDRLRQQPRAESGGTPAGPAFFSAHLFCLQGATGEGQTFARHFTPPPGAFEDPFTGSATGGMGAYVWRYGLVKSPRFVAEQGHWMHRPGRATVEVVGPPEAITAVRVGGMAALVLRGELLLPG